MKNALKDAGLVQNYSAPMDGVFSTGDLCNLFGEQNPVLLYRRIQRLEEGKILKRFSRGFYIAPQFNKETLAGRLVNECYLSLGTVLAKELMIGSIPATTVYAIRVGKNRRFESPHLTIEYVSISRNLYFGYSTADGIRYASPEKALLDTLYFHLRGRSYSFDIYQDIDISRLDLNIANRWLKAYRNPRFVSFVKGYLNDRSK